MRPARQVSWFLCAFCCVFLEDHSREAGEHQPRRNTCMCSCGGGDNKSMEMFSKMRSLRSYAQVRMFIFRLPLLCLRHYFRLAGGWHEKFYFFSGCNKSRFKSSHIPGNYIRIRTPPNVGGTPIILRWDSGQQRAPNGQCAGKRRVSRDAHRPFAGDSRKSLKPRRVRAVKKDGDGRENAGR